MQATYYSIGSILISISAPRRFYLLALQSCADGRYIVAHIARYFVLGKPVVG